MLYSLILAQYTFRSYTHGIDLTEVWYYSMCEKLYKNVLSAVENTTVFRILL